MMMVIILFFLLFGAKRIPEFARSLGEGFREFQKARQELEPPSLDEPIEARARRLSSPEDAPGIPEGASAEISERFKVLSAAKGLGITVEGRSLEEIKAEMRAILDDAEAKEME